MQIQKSLPRRVGFHNIFTDVAECIHHQTAVKIWNLIGHTLALLKPARKTEDEIFYKRMVFYDMQYSLIHSHSSCPVCCDIAATSFVKSLITALASSSVFRLSKVFSSSSSLVSAGF